MDAFGGIILMFGCVVLALLAIVAFASLFAKD